jgi:CheY-like chemotaxis protein
MQGKVILIVEDNHDDFELTVQALNKAGCPSEIKRCENGDEALDYLFRRGKYADPASSPRPSVILLDLNLPGTDGRETLQEVKTDTDLRKIPVVVLTTSIDQRDVDACYNAGANSYMHKPAGLRSFNDSIERFSNFWFRSVLLPLS